MGSGGSVAKRNSHAGEEGSHIPCTVYEEVMNSLLELYGVTVTVVAGDAIPSRVSVERGVRVRVGRVFRWRRGTTIRGQGE